MGERLPKVSIALQSLARPLSLSFQDSDSLALVANKRLPLATTFILPLRSLGPQCKAPFWHQLLVEKTVLSHSKVAGILAPCRGRVLTLWAAQIHGRNVVDITFVHNAASKGAVCLDGSPPAYYHSKGFGEGVNNWIVFLEGGAWCVNDQDCAERSIWSQGNSTRWEKRTNFTGILTNSSPTTNPDFYSWNKVYVKYCDGGSFAGDVEQTLVVNRTTTYKIYNVTIRGARIFQAVVDDLLAKGMKNADNAMLAGYSAGGLATMIQCDHFRILLPKARRVKCFVDAGFFVHGKGIRANLTDREAELRNIVKLHALEKILPKSCTSKMEPYLCAFSGNLIEYIDTPVFILESAFDTYQLMYSFPRNETWWNDCLLHGTNCTVELVQWQRDFRRELLKELPKGNCASRGIYVANCARHGYANDDKDWNGPTIMVNNKTMAKTVGDWYFDRCYSQDIEADDTPYYC